MFSIFQAQLSPKLPSGIYWTAQNITLLYEAPPLSLPGKARHSVIIAETTTDWTILQQPHTVDTRDVTPTALLNAAVPHHLVTRQCWLMGGLEDLKES